MSIRMTNEIFHSFSEKEKSDFYINPVFFEEKASSISKWSEKILKFIFFLVDISMIKSEIENKREW